MQGTAYEDWTVLIKKYIKDHSIEDYHHEVVEGILYNAFAHKENTPHVNGQILHPEKSKIGISIVSGNNESILKSLSNGAQAITLKIDDQTNLEALLQDVNLTYIRSCFILSKDTQKDNLIQYLDSQYSLNSLAYVITNSPEFNCKSVKKHFTLLQSDHQNGIDALVDLCNQVKKSNDPVCLELNLTTKFFFEIARIRALYILIANIKGEQSLNDVRIMVNLPKTTSKEQLVQHTVSTLSGYLGGATIINAGTINKDLNEISRLQINIQNILQLESKINLHHDPMAGSYFMEDLTSKICNSIWSKLNQE